MDTKYEPELDENYTKYINILKIYYDKNSICPTNNKLELHKEYNNNNILIKCDDDKFNFEIKLPEYHNIYDELIKLRLSRDKCLQELKNNIIYEKNIDNFNKYKQLYMTNIKQIESYNNILNEDDKHIINLDSEIIKIKDNINNIFKERKECFSKLEKIDKKKKKKIIELFSKKYPLSDTEIDKNRKSLNITYNNLKYWLLWLSKVKDYVINMKLYNNKYHKYEDILNNIFEKNKSFIFVKPVINNLSKSSKIQNKYSNIKNIKNIKNKTSGLKNKII